jgi:acetylornithine deacetylase/succinyl-diaminopimelate desuccinylase-like protein
MRALAETAARGEDLVRILADLVAIPTPNPPGATAEICAYVGERLARSGYAVSTIREEPGCDNLVASLGRGSPHLVFNVHLDTVGLSEGEPWLSDPLTLRRAGDSLFGLGACNAKGCAAVHIAAAEALASSGGPARGTVSFTFVTDDENVGPRGTAYLRRQGLKPDFLVIGGPTENALIVEERGVMWVAIETRGLAAHAGAPEAGDNAIMRMMRLLSRLEGDLAPRLVQRRDGGQRSTMNIGLVHGGSNTNVVPDACRVEIDRRLLVSETVEDAFEEVVEVLAGAGEPADRWSATLMRGTNAFRSPADGALLRTMEEAVEAATGAPARFVQAVGAGDGRYFADDGIQILTIGPGDGAESHCRNERISLHQMHESLAIQLAFLARIWRTA